MRVIHTQLIYASSERTVYAAAVVDCRWTNKERGKWTGKHIEDTGAKFETTGSTWSQSDREKADALSRAEAARLKLPAGPDVFPFAR